MTSSKSAGGTKTKLLWSAAPGETGQTTGAITVVGALRSFTRPGRSCALSGSRDMENPGSGSKKRCDEGLRDVEAKTSTLTDDEGLHRTQNQPWIFC